MENTDVIKERFKFRVAVSKIKEEERIGIRKRSDYIGRKIGTAACACLILTTGIVFAKDIKNFVVEQFENFGLGKGVTTAIENDYIAKGIGEVLEQNVEVIENNEVIDNLNLKYKVDQFIITDTNISIDFNFEFENKINDYVDLGKTIGENINYERSHIIELSDLFIVNENNEVIYCNKYDNELFKEYCANNNIEYDLKSDEMINMTDVRKFYTTEEFLGADIVCTINYLTEHLNSKQLNIYFSKINMYLENENERQITLKGNWAFKLDVPEKMYDREAEYYKVVSTENDNFEVYEAKVTDTAFELGVRISNIEEPEYPKELQEREAELLNGKGFVNGSVFESRENFIEFYGDEKYADLYSDYMNKNTPIRVDGYSPDLWGDKTEETYILNSNGSKFRSVYIADRNKVYKFINNLKQFEFYETFEMTKYDATDNITVIINFQGTPVHINLEKVKN